MLTTEQAEQLGKKLETLRCTEPEVASGLFLFVFREEPENEAAKYEAHLSKCEYCRVALEIHRYQRDIARLLKPKTTD